MARGSSEAQQASKTANNQAQTSYGNANALFGPLSTSLLTEAAHPTGIDPTTMGRMDTAAMEAAGGAGAGALGTGLLRAARTRNAGGADAATQEAARQSGQTASRGILGNRVKSAEMASENRQRALSGLGNLFGQNLSGGTSALGEVAANTNADTQAKHQSWDWASQLVVPLAQAAGSAAGGYMAGGKRP